MSAVEDPGPFAHVVGQRRRSCRAQTWFRSSRWPAATGRDRRLDSFMGSIYVSLRHLAHWEVWMDAQPT